MSKIVRYDLNLVVKTVCQSHTCFDSCMRNTHKVFAPFIKIVFESKKLEKYKNNYAENAFNNWATPEAGDCE